MYVPAKTFNAWPRSVQTLFTQVAQETMQKDLAALPKVEADAMDKFRATGGSVVPMKDIQNFIARSPDMIQIWVDKSTKDGLGEKIKDLVPLQRKAAQSFVNSRN
jgi:TRAP-type C4-dicarboxylate transport system substrate-binding protein